MKIVADTNVIISGLFWKSGNPHKILELCELGIAQLLFSEKTLRELSDVLETYFQMPANEIEDILRFLLEKAAVVDVRSSLDVCADKKDNKFVELAIDGQADYIVSGDRHLKEIKEFRGIKILPPAEFIKIISG